MRTAGEYDSTFGDGHIIGAVNIDFGGPTFNAVLDLLPKEKTYLVYCRSGNRSGLAVGEMQPRGFIDVYNMSNGFSVFETIPAHIDLIE